MLDLKFSLNSRDDLLVQPKEKHDKNEKILAYMKSFLLFFGILFTNIDAETVAIIVVLRLLIGVFWIVGDHQGT